jgi:hypothetical protein
MTKRPTIDLSALTSDAATPMIEAAQRSARSVPKVTAPDPAETTRTANLQGLAFKVSPAFRKRFRQRAANADLKLNELLFAALDAWEEKHGIR